MSLAFLIPAHLLLPDGDLKPILLQRARAREPISGGRP